MFRPWRVRSMARKRHTAQEVVAKLRWDARERSPQGSSQLRPIRRPLNAHSCDTRTGTKASPRAFLPRGSFRQQESPSNAFFQCIRRMSKELRNQTMKHSFRNSLIFAIAGVLALSVAALAASRPMNIRGTISQVDGNTIDIKESDGGVAKVHLADNAKIVSVAKASLSDIKPGSFIGTAATPRADGKLQAIEVHIFPESMRGTGEGSRTWDLTSKSKMTNGTAAPKSSMTNGTVAQKSNKVEDNKVNRVEG